MRLDQDALERLEVGVPAEEVHLANGAVLDVIGQPAGGDSRSPWHANHESNLRSRRQY
jgi:hypothetical protein